MCELPVVDAFQSHPFNGHLQREINTYTPGLRPDLTFRRLGRIGNRQCVQPSFCFAQYYPSTVIDWVQRRVGIINRERASEDANWDCIGHLSHIISITRRHPPAAYTNCRIISILTREGGFPHVQQGNYEAIFTSDRTNVLRQKLL